MASTANFDARATDWREQLRRNEKRSKQIILLFVLIYLFVGFLVDIVIVTHSLIPMESASPPGYLSASQAAYLLLTFKITPLATITMAVIALLSILITYRFHDKLMLLGTNSKEITPDSADFAEQQLYNIIEEMKVAAGLRYMPKVYIIEAGYMNAFASGYSEKSALVAITRGLLSKLDRAELQAVMAHELSHIRHHDIKLNLMASVLTSIMLVVIDLLFYGAIFGRGKKDGRLIFIIILLRYLLPTITILLTLALSRTREYMADAGAVELMRDNDPMARALLKIHNDYSTNREEYQMAFKATAHEELRRASYIYDPTLAGVRPDDSINSLFSTHPSLKKRLKALGYTQKNAT